MSLAEARRGASSRSSSRAGRGQAPTRIFLDRTIRAARLVRLVLRPRIVLSEVAGDGLGLLQKTVGPATSIEELRVDGSPGLWVRGADHVLRAFDANGAFSERAVRVHGAVLVWVEKGVTFRLEGELTRAQALAIATSLR